MQQMSSQVEDSGLHDSEASVEKQYDVQDTFVLQCARCRAIIGDSTAWVCFSEKLNAVALHKVTQHVEVSEERHISSEGFDQGCAYDVLHCMQCKTVLGKMYVTTPRLLDNLREAFTFDVLKISSYQIGSAEQESRLGSEYCFSIPTAVGMEIKFNKLKAVVMSLADRIDQIESELEVQEHEDDKLPDDVVLVNDDVGEANDKGSKSPGTGQGGQNHSSVTHADSQPDISVPQNGESALSKSKPFKGKHDKSTNKITNTVTEEDNHSDSSSGKVDSVLNGETNSKTHDVSDSESRVRGEGHDSRKHKRSNSRDETDSFSQRKKTKRKKFL